MPNTSGAVEFSKNFKMVRFTNEMFGLSENLAIEDIFIYMQGTNGNAVKNGEIEMP